MLYVSTSYKETKLEKHLICFQINPGTFYLFDDLTQVGRDFKDRKEFDAWLVEKNAKEALVLSGSAEQYTVAVPSVNLPGKAVEAINKLIRQLVDSPSDCFYFQPLLTEGSLTGMARHHVRATLGENPTEEQISQVTKEQVASIKQGNKKAFLQARLKKIAASGN